ncbi:MAG: WD40 repeat domain-containing protein [Candidatus Kariarchaeaceae archaeon]|jgi:dipeptidyl aminopeptidase/acylaminoacyl peptidase
MFLIGGYFGTAGQVIEYNIPRVISISPDGSKIGISYHWLSEENPGSINVWDIQSKKQLFTTQGVSANSLIWNPNSTKILVQSSQKCIILDGNNGTSYLTNELSSSAISDQFLGWSPNGNLIAFSEYVYANFSSKNVAKIWDITSNTHLYTLNPNSTIQTIRWSPDGNRIATENLFSHPLEKLNVSIWNSSNGNELYTISLGATIPNPTRSIEWSPDSKLLATISGENRDEISIWNSSSFKKILEFNAGNTISELSWSPNGKLLAGSVSGPYLNYGEGGVLIWDVNTGNKLHSVEMSNADVFGLFSVWQPTIHELESTLLINSRSGGIKIITIKEDGNGIIVGDLNEINGWFPVYPLSSNEHNIWSSDGSSFIYLTDTKLKVFDISKMKATLSIPLESDYISVSIIESISVLSIWSGLLGISIIAIIIGGIFLLRKRTPSTYENVPLLVEFLLISSWMKVLIFGVFGISLLFIGSINSNLDYQIIGIMSLVYSAMFFRLSKNLMRANKSINYYLMIVVLGFFIQLSYLFFTNLLDKAINTLDNFVFILLFLIGTQVLFIQLVSLLLHRETLLFFNSDSNLLELQGYGYDKMKQIIIFVGSLLVLVIGITSLIFG